MAPIHEAAKRGDVEDLSRLLDQDPGLLQAAAAGGRGAPLWWACCGGHLEAARLLLDRGAEVDAVDGLEKTALMDACWFGHAEVARLLLDRGADPSLRNEGSWTALMAAADGRTAGHEQGYCDIIGLLLQDGRVPVDVRDDRGTTPLWRACFCGHTERARVLLVEGRADHHLCMEAAESKGHKGCMALLQVGPPTHRTMPCSIIHSTGGPRRSLTHAL